MLRILAAIVALCAIGAFAGFIVFKDDAHWRDGEPRHASRGAFRGAFIALVACCIAIGVCICSVVSAHARPSSYPPVTPFNGDRYSAQTQLGPEVTRDIQRQRAAKARRAAPTRRHVPSRKMQRWDGPVPLPVPRRGVAEPGSVEPLSVARGVWREAARVIGGRPQGCPSRFCGCGASLHLFGRIIPSLNLASNWLRFPRAAPAPKMVAARRGHVFVLERHIAGNTWLVHDSNSGGRRTRIHPRSIAGYTIVNPQGGRG